MFDSDFIANPYKIYNHLRAAAPLLWTDKFRSGAWLETRYADVVAGLHDPLLSSQRSHTLTAALPSEVQCEFSKFNEIFSKWMLFLDPPHHSRLRKLLNKEFTPNMIQRLRPRIKHVVDTLLDHALAKSEMEFMTEFANRGMHFCIGAALAQAEAEIAFTTLLDRTSSLTLLDDAPAWRANLSFRGLSKLRI